LYDADSVIDDAPKSTRLHVVSLQVNPLVFQTTMFSSKTKRKV